MWKKKHKEFHQFYKQSTEKKWRTKLNVIIATIDSRNEYGSSRTYNLITIYRASLSMKQNYHNDFLNTLMYSIIINPLRFNGDSQAPFHWITPDNNSITPDSSASLGLLQQFERRQYSFMFDFFKYNLIMR